MVQVSRYRRKGPGASRAAALVCLILLILLATVQVVHVHSVDTDADHCPLCIVMHSAAPVVLAALLIVLIRIGVQTPVIEVRAATLPCWHPSLFIRPPPSV